MAKRTADYYTTPENAADPYTAFTERHKLADERLQRAQEHATLTERYVTARAALQAIKARHASEIVQAKADYTAAIDALAAFKHRPK